MEKFRVLLFAANPVGTSPLDLPREFREIDEEVSRGTFRDVVELILVPGTRPVDLIRRLNENQPQVVHFSSHGNPDEIVLESEEDSDAPHRSGGAARSTDDRDMKLVRPDGADQGISSTARPQVVSKSALVSVLSSCTDGSLRLVVLNACHTRSQAEALTEVVDCVVSMNRSISDRAAIKFAASFYGALAYGRSVQKAFDQGVARLRVEGIAEADTPELLVRACVDASRVVLVGPTRDTSEPTPAVTPQPVRQVAWVRWGIPAGIVACGLMALAAWGWSMRSEPATAVELPNNSKPAASPVQAEIAVEHWKELGDGRRVELHGTISESSLARDPPLFKDLLRIQATLSPPAYSYLIALNPNGTIQLCATAGGAVPSTPRGKLIFPDNPDDYFGLTDGVGLQAFVVVAFDHSLPAYESWKAQVPGGLAWSSVDREGFWTYDSAELSEAKRVRGELRGDILRRESASEVLIDLCDRIRRSPGVTLVRAVAFPVKPEEDIMK
jgi:CHAT domain